MKVYCSIDYVALHVAVLVSLLLQLISKVRVIHHEASLSLCVFRARKRLDYICRVPTDFSNYCHVIVNYQISLNWFTR